MSASDDAGTGEPPTAATPITAPADPENNSAAAADTPATSSAAPETNNAAPTDSLGTPTEALNADIAKTEAVSEQPATDSNTAASAADEEPGLGFVVDTKPAASTSGGIEDGAPKPVFLAGRRFGNRTELVEQIKKIQESMADDDGSNGELSNADNLLIFHLILHHPKAVEKMTNPISHFRYGIYDKFKNKCFISVHVDGSQEGFSAAKSVDAIFPKGGKETSADKHPAGAGAQEQRGKKREREEREEKPQREPRVFQPQVMVRGCVIEIKSLPPGAQYHRLRDELEGFGRVRHLEFIKHRGGARPTEIAAKPAKAEQAAEEAECKGNAEPSENVAKRAKTEQIAEEADGKVGAGPSETAAKRTKAEPAAEEAEDEEEEENEEDEVEEDKNAVTGITARCRFFEAEGATAAVEGFRQNPVVQGTEVEVALLAGAEEDMYWEETNKRLKEAFENPKGKGKKGKGKGKGKDSKGKGKGKKGAKGKDKNKSSD